MMIDMVSANGVGVVDNQKCTKTLLATLVACSSKDITELCLHIISLKANSLFTIRKDDDDWHGFGQWRWGR